MCVVFPFFRFLSLPITTRTNGLGLWLQQINIYNRRTALLACSSVGVYPSIVCWHLVGLKSDFFLFEIFSRGEE